METNRLEAFSDGVLAIVITIMVLELQVPEEPHLSDLVHTTGTYFLSYLLSFVYVGIYWNNHHHMFQVVDRVRGGILWANLHLLFWLSLFPFTTNWMDESDFSRTPTAIYGLNLFAAAVAYWVLQTMIIRSQGPGSRLREAVGADFKGKASPILYGAGIVCALLIGSLSDAWAWLAIGFYVAVAIMWLVPDRRLERYLAEYGRSD